MAKKFTYYSNEAANTFTFINHKGGGLGQDGGSLGAISTLTSNLIVMSVVSYVGTGAFPIISDSKGNTWIPLTRRIDVAGVRYEQLYYCINPTTDASHVFTALVLFGYVSLNVIAFKSTGVPTFGQQQGGNAASGTNANVGNITPVIDNTLFITGLSANLGTTPITIDSSFNVTDSSGFNGVDRSASAIAYKIQTVQGAENPKWTWINASEPCFSMATFKP